MDCPAVYSVTWQSYDQGLNADEITALQQEVLEQCINDFKAQGINLDAYNSLELAGDVNSVRQALGYDRIFYYGMSYGSQLGQHVMREYPEILEAVILDGASPLSRLSWIEDRALDVQFGMDNLVALCQENQKCQEAYPDIPGLLDAALRIFDDGPIPYTYSDPNDPNTSIQLEITASDFAGWLYGKLTDQYSVYAIPLMLHMLTQPDLFEATFGELIGTANAQSILASAQATKGETPYLMHLAVVCSDDPVKSADEIILEGASEFGKLLAPVQASDYLKGCAAINVQELPDSTDENVNSDIPVLLLSGGTDVKTPPVRSQLIADALPNATMLVFPARLHVQLTQFNGCAADLYTQFIADPSAALDTSCLETPDAGIAAFALPDGTSSVDVEP